MRFTHNLDDVAVRIGDDATQAVIPREQIVVSKLDAGLADIISQFDLATFGNGFKTILIDRSRVSKRLGG